MQRPLQVDHDLAPVGEGQGDHAAAALGVDIGIGVVIEGVTAQFHRLEQGFGTVHEFKVGHYNSLMLSRIQILVRLIALVAAGALFGCGQRGPLYLPQDPAAAQRATLPQVLTPDSLRSQTDRKPSDDAPPATPLTPTTTTP